MGVFYCSRCSTRYVTAPFNTDVIHDCNSGDKTLDEEDMVKLGDFTNPDGTSGVQNTGALMKTTENTAQGTTAGLLGAHINTYNIRGKRKVTHRSRKRFLWNKVPMELTRP